MDMTRDAIIGEDIRGWFINDNRGHLEGYDNAYAAGLNGDLPWLDSIEKITTFCKENNCDLFTSDKKSYSMYFDDKVKSIQITKKAHWRDGNRAIFMMRIIE